MKGQLADGTLVAVLTPSEAGRVMVAYGDQVRAEPKVFADPREARRRLLALTVLLADEAGETLVVRLASDLRFGPGAIYVRWTLDP